MTSYSAHYAGHSGANELGEDGLSVLALSLLWDIPSVIIDDAATINWRVESWSTTTTGVRSPWFICNGVKWRLLCYPRGSPNSAPGSVSLFLDRGNYGQTTDLPPICVQYALVLSNPRDPYIFTGQSVAKRIASGELISGFERFCSDAEINTRVYGNSFPIVANDQVDVTVFLRVMHDPAQTLWMLGAPSQPTANEEEEEDSRPITPLPSAPVASTSRSAQASTSNATPNTPKSEIPQRAAYPGEECMVCADEPLLFPNKPPTAVCQHEPRICLSCLQSHISIEVSGKGGGPDGVVCPAPDCAEMMDYHEIKFWADEGTFTKYDRFLTRRALGVEDDFVLCTNPSCDGGQIHTEGVSAPIVTCYVCHQRTCFTHQIAWHDGFTCDEWDERQKSQAGSKTTEAYLAKYTKGCPRCKKPIEKSVGCDAMTCKLPAGCGHTFCWLCLAPYEAILRDGNHRHLSSCRHYAPFDEPRTSTGHPPVDIQDYDIRTETGSSLSVASLPAVPAVLAAPVVPAVASPLVLAPLTLAHTTITTPTTTSAIIMPGAAISSAFNARTAPADFAPQFSSQIAGTSRSVNGEKWYRFWKDS